MPRVLVVGGGPAGSVTAYWLAKAGFEVVVAERSTVEPYGQGIDVTDEAVDVVKRMGLLEQIKSSTTGESGFTMVDDAGKDIASLGTNPSEKGKEGFGSPTQEIEIMRGTLVNILAQAAKDQGAEFRYGCTVSELVQDENSVTVNLSGQSETFSAVIGADGVASRVRKLAFDKAANDNCYRQTDTYVAYFSMKTDNHVSNSRLQHANKGRVIWMRPINKTHASCYLIITSPGNEDLQDAAVNGTEDSQRALLEKLYQNVDGLREGAIRGMYDSKDFYFTRVVQVRLDSWHNGRCALVGDAGYCPSPLTGQGTTIALLGAYILAGELARNPGDPAAAFSEYKRRFEGFVKEEGAIPLGGQAPKVFVPQSDIGVWTLRSIFRFVARPTVQKLFSSLPSLPSFGQQQQGKIQLPEYVFEKAE